MIRAIFILEVRPRIESGCKRAGLSQHRRNFEWTLKHLDLGMCGGIALNRRIESLGYMRVGMHVMQGADHCSPDKLDQIRRRRYVG